MILHLLALETSSSVCDVAVLSCIDDVVHVRSASVDQTGRHAECLLPMVDQVLEQAGITRADLDAIAFGQGPGGFTGLRVASGVTQGIAFGLDLPVIPVSSLLAVAVRASQVSGPDRQRLSACYIIVQDARMGEVYLAVYRSPDAEHALWQTVHDPILIDARHVQAWFGRQAQSWGLNADTPVNIAGDALDAYPFLADLDNGHGRVGQAGSLRADARTIARIAHAAWQRGDTEPPENAVPLYVRDKVAYTIAEREGGAGGNPRAPAYGIRVDAMSEKHLDAVAAIEARVQSYPWTRKNFADGLKAGYPGWVAHEGGHVLGFYLVMMAPDVAHLLVIAVDPDHQGKGVGKLLLDHCQAQATDKGLDTMVLEVRVTNHGAIGFYEHHGFRTFGVRKGYYPVSHDRREDASVMKKHWQLAKASA